MSNVDGSIEMHPYFVISSTYPVNLLWCARIQHQADFGLVLPHNVKFTGLLYRPSDLTLTLVAFPIINYMSFHYLYHYLIMISMPRLKEMIWLNSLIVGTHHVVWPSVHTPSTLAEGQGISAEGGISYHPSQLHKACVTNMKELSYENSCTNSQKLLFFASQSCWKFTYDLEAQFPDHMWSFSMISRGKFHYVILTLLILVCFTHVNL